MSDLLHVLTSFNGRINRFEFWIKGILAIVGIWFGLSFLILLVGAGKGWSPIWLVGRPPSWGPGWASPFALSVGTTAISLAGGT